AAASGVRVWSLRGDRPACDHGRGAQHARRRGLDRGLCTGGRRGRRTRDRGGRGPASARGARYPASIREDSFSPGVTHLLEGPSYTRPEVWRGLDVPEVLRSGDHARIGRFNRDEALRRTAARRPELLRELRNDELDARDREVLDDVFVEGTAGDPAAAD